MDEKNISSDLNNNEVLSESQSVANPIFPTIKQEQTDDQHQISHLNEPANQNEQIYPNSSKNQPSRSNQIKRSIQPNQNNQHINQLNQLSFDLIKTLIQRDAAGQSNSGDQRSESNFKKISQLIIEWCKQSNVSNNNAIAFKEVKPNEVRQLISKFKLSTKFIIHFGHRSTTAHQIHSMCIRFDDEAIGFYLKSIEMIHHFREELNKCHFQFTNNPLCICFDIKLTYKVMRCLFEIDESNLNKISWNDVKVSHWFCLAFV